MVKNKNNSIVSNLVTLKVSVLNCSFNLSKIAINQKNAIT